MLFLYLSTITHWGGNGLGVCSVTFEIVINSVARDNLRWIVYNHWTGMVHWISTFVLNIIIEQCAYHICITGARYLERSLVDSFQ